jgi:hypothetical protein
MASDHTLSQKVGIARVDKREGMFEDIELRVFEVRRCMDLRNVENEEIEGSVKSVRELVVERDTIQSLREEARSSRIDFTSYFCFS